MKRPTIHIVGAGLSGLSAALRLADVGRFEIVLHECGLEPGGRRRALFDPADGACFDGFNTLIWPHWRATRALISAVRADGEWRSGERAIAFVDMRTGERWTSRPAGGRWPLWALFAGQRAPGLTAGDYFRLSRFARSAGAARLGSWTPPRGLATERLWRPLALAALNSEPAGAAADLLAATLQEALDAPKIAPLFPVRNFRHALLLPLVQQLGRRGVALRCERTLQSLKLAADRIVALEFAHDTILLRERDAVVLAVPPWVAAPLVPGLLTPDEFSATITAHFAVAPPAKTPDLTVVLNGPVHAVFRRPDGLWVSVRDAGGDLGTPKEALAAKYWAAVAPITGLSDVLPAWRLIKQKSAAFAATKAQNALRPEPTPPWRNLVLAGGYVRNGLPETMESAVRSGERAAELLAQRV